MKRVVVSLALMGCHQVSPAGEGVDAPAAGADAGLTIDARSDASPDAPAGCSAVSGTAIDHSLAITDPVVLARFPFSRVMQRIVDTGAPGQSPTALYQQWMTTFGPSDCTDPAIDPNHYGETCPRTPEFKLASIDPMDPASLVKFVPVAVFDRFDLAPTDGSNCGEHRIIYAMQSTDPNIGGRGFYIFEAALPNPEPGNGLAGCLPIAQFWQGLSTLETSEQLADAVEKFYFLGTAIPHVPAVVDALHYGAAFAGGGARRPGQIRTNMFIDNVSWQLREFKTSAPCGSTPGCTLTLQHVAVATNPASELFDGTAANAPAFVTAFAAQVAALGASSVTSIGMTIDGSFDTYESVSNFNANAVLYDQQANAAITDAVQAQLTQLGSTLAPADILRRATTQTCAGCHQLSAGAEADLGGGMIWPASNLFTHVDEQSKLSPALTTEFLPHRKDVLEGFINSICTNAPLAGRAGWTIGGSRVGAAN